MMRIEQLQYLLKVAEAGSFTQAARELFMTQPSLSKAIKELEKELNRSLFIRKKTGAILTVEGEEFLSYDRQVIEQFELLKGRYQGEAPKRIFSVASQHYAFAVDAFVRLLKQENFDHYQANFKELRTFEVIEEVENLKCEVGVLDRSKYNGQVLNAQLKERQLTFVPLRVAKPHVFVFRNHPLVNQDQVTFEDLAPFPRLSYEQGDYNSFYFWEETYADRHVAKQIIVSDRATLFNLAIGLKGYTISSGIINSDLNGDDIVAIPLLADEAIEIGYITNNRHTLTPMAVKYLAILEERLRVSQ